MMKGKGKRKFLDLLEFLCNFAVDVVKSMLMIFLRRGENWQYLYKISDIV
jgi:hypothetical protein